MKTILIKTSFPTTHFGHLKAGEKYPLPDHFADFVVEKMRAGEYVKQPPKTTKSRKKNKAE